MTPLNRTRPRAELLAVGPMIALLPIAHVGHWYHSLIYAVPVLLIVLVLIVGTWRDRRLKRQEAEGGSERSEGRDGSEGSSGAEGATGAEAD